MAAIFSSLFGGGQKEAAPMAAPAAPPAAEKEKTAEDAKKKARAYLGSLEPSKGFSGNKLTAKSFLLSY
jgi:hypothetical protein